MFIDGDSAAIEEQTKLFWGKKCTEAKERTPIHLDHRKLPGSALLRNENPVSFNQQQ